MSNKKLFAILFITILVIGLWFIPILGVQLAGGIWGPLYIPIFIINMIWFLYLTEAFKKIQ